MSTRAFEQPSPGVAEAPPSRRASSLVPQAVVDAALGAVDRVAKRFVLLGISANAVTIGSLLLAAGAGVSLALGSFGPAAVLGTASALGDALDGAVARRAGGGTVGSALLDASADRYGEFFMLSGLAVHFHDHLGALVLTLAAMSGSFMVSYGSAKAEALGRPVPAGIMRRAERAICLCAGISVTACLTWFAGPGELPAWAARAPMFAALGLLAVLANASAVARLRLVARGSTSRP